MRTKRTLKRKMQCQPALTLSSDIAVWISREDFYEYTNQDDYLNRNRRSITHAYLSEWFIPARGEITKFLLPTIQVLGNTTQFINGRHRTAVLLEYLSEVPIVFAYEDTSSQTFPAGMRIKPVRINQCILLPDLPTLDHLP